MLIGREIEIANQLPLTLVVELGVSPITEHCQRSGLGKSSRPRSPGRHLSQLHLNDRLPPHLGLGSLAKKVLVFEASPPRKCGLIGPFLPQPCRNAPEAVPGTASDKAFLREPGVYILYIAGIKNVVDVLRFNLSYLW